MIQKVTIIGIMIMLTMIFSTSTLQSDFPVLKGPYLGQKPPGDVPELFAPGSYPVFTWNTAVPYSHPMATNSFGPGKLTSVLHQELSLSCI